MAIIFPYNDPNAHGSIAGASFRRRGNIVVFQKKPKPKQPNTPGQIAQRQAFSDAAKAWYSYDATSKEYFYKRGKELGMSARNLFISAYLKGIMPSTTELQFKEITNIQIQTPAAPELKSWKFRFINRNLGHDMGIIFDNENIFDKETTYENVVNIGIVIIAWEDTLILPFRYAFYLQGKLQDDSIEERIIRLPVWTLYPVSSKQFFFSDDGSCFYDVNLSHLAATNNF